MALRCERCRTSELTLETFGVYRCPICGRVDADGNLVDRPPDGNDTGPQTFDTGRASFAAPPPSTSAPSAMVTPVAHTTSGPPTVFLVTLGVTVALDVLNAVLTHTGACGVVLVLFYACLLTGKRWARTVSLALAVLSVGVCAMAFVLPQIGTQIRIALIVTLAANAWWIYVLVRPDTAAYFSR